MAPTSPDDLWQELRDAHEQAGVSTSDGVPVHAPKAAILACSDARVPPSLVFDRPAGDLFVVRLAGNSASPAAIASMDYAVEHLGVQLVVVLGHTECGAVAAAASGVCGGPLAAVVRPICDIAEDHPGAGNDELVALNVAATVRTLRDHDGATGTAARAGEVLIQGAVHDLRRGTLEPVVTPGIVPVRR